MNPRGDGIEESYLSGATLKADTARTSVYRGLVTAVTPAVRRLHARISGLRFLGPFSDQQLDFLVLVSRIDTAEENIVNFLTVGLKCFNLHLTSRPRFIIENKSRFTKL